MRRNNLATYYMSGMQPFQFSQWIWQTKGYLHAMHFCKEPFSDFRYVCLKMNGYDGMRLSWKKQFCLSHNFLSFTIKNVALPCVLHVSCTKHTVENRIHGEIGDFISAAFKII